MVGLIPLFAVETLEPEMLGQLPGFTKRLDWFIEHRPDLTATSPACGRRDTASDACCRSSTPNRLDACCKVMLDEQEFLSPYGIRALSRLHRDEPYLLVVDGERAPRRTTSRANRRPACSAATRTGAGRSGFR